MASNCAAKAGGGVCLCQQQYRNLNIYKDNKRGDARRGDEKGWKRGDIRVLSRSRNQIVWCNVPHRHHVHMIVMQQRSKWVSAPGERGYMCWHGRLDVLRQYNLTFPALDVAYVHVALIQKSWNWSTRNVECCIYVVSWPSRIHTFAPQDRTNGAIKGRALMIMNVFLSGVVLTSATFSLGEFLHLPKQKYLCR